MLHGAKINKNVKQKISHKNLDVGIATGGKTAAIYIDSKGKDYNGLKLVAESFAADVNLVTGLMPAVVTNIDGIKGTVIIAGTVGNNDIIDSLINKGELDISDIENKRECFKIQVVEKPASEVDRAVIIIGSEKRGTIYGIYHMSELIGISPWVYWGDVLPVRKPELIIAEDSLNFTSREPSVKYRGFFLNDEWPSLDSWAAGMFGGFNEEFYEKVFQLLLRLKGNFLWPAMWSSVFSEDGKSSSAANARLADAYGIVMGTSHHEPMFRAGKEWKNINRQYGTNGAWDFSKNAEAITRFWEDALLRNKDFESLITIGMRGEQDSALEGTERENIELLKNIIKTQKALLKKHGMEKRPQVLTIYKEVEKYWYGSENSEGLRHWDILDDVTIMLADDNFANVRTLPSEAEQNRKSGWGMYYHFDYHGGPVSYEWINTTPLEKVWEQMSMTYAYGVRDIWIVNVGDLKPMELPVSYFLELAYDFDTWGTAGINKTGEYTKRWVSQQFGNNAGKEIINGIAGLLSDYTKMNGSKKPEVTFASTYSCTNYNEAHRVLARAIDMEKRAKKYRAMLSEECRDAYYQLVYYPAAASANIVKMQIYAGLNNLYFRRKSALANFYADLVQECIETDENMQKFYNRGMSGGKWKGMMSSHHIGYTYWNPDGWTYPKTGKVMLEEGSCLIVDAEGAGKECRSGCTALPAFTNPGKESYSVTISNGGRTAFDYRIETSADWIKADSAEGCVIDGRTIAVSVDWAKVLKDSNGFISIYGADEKVQVNITAQVLNTDGLPVLTFVETNGVVSIEAEHTANKASKAAAQWRTIENYGRTLSSVKMFPVTAFFEKPEDAPFLEYIIKTERAMEYILTTYAAPSNNLYKNSRLRYGVSFDGGNIVIADALPPDFAAGDYDNDSWCKAVLENIHLTETKHFLTKGIHTLRLYGMDAGLVLQKLVLSGEKLPDSFFGPEESFYIKPSPVF
ncbi:glycosyl hydrolase family 115 (putative glucuronidase) [Ruminiclostridium sufflavum DSM 19573]|uniref:Glycosyl hydrolase family 115 (Putative glucuronidase) n=1 Tax=Ruminiclostridium sufflavum DSM 19573 TaxID=1121337 RepID=A0A318XGR5_9FIRM|nr:glycosyl hydrolase 115 family protein [Ruminiclostridium sufflavum]PYG85629.1 glycosyl hydrolase family 115 (putative glucuronidase) [Ruminiclostridium sufflavum DSM 19573]